MVDDLYRGQPASHPTDLWIGTIPCDPVRISKHRQWIEDSNQLCLPIPLKCLVWFLMKLLINLRLMNTFYFPGSVCYCKALAVYSYTFIGTALFISTLVIIAICMTKYNPLFKNVLFFCTSNTSLYWCKPWASTCLKITFIKTIRIIYQCLKIHI